MKSGKEISVLNIHDLTLQRIDEMLMQAQSFQVDLETGSGYKEVEICHKQAKALHLSVRNREKELLAPFKEEINGIKAKMKEVQDVSMFVQDKLDPIIEILAEKRSSWENVVAERKAQKEREEQERVAGIRTKINGIAGLISGIPSLDSVAINALITEIEAIQITVEEYQEFIAEANLAKHDAFEQAHVALEARLKYEQEEADRKALAKRLADQKAAQEAEAKRLEDVRLENERKDREAREAIEREKAKAEAELAEQRRKIEAEQAAFEAEKKAERDRIEREALERRLAEEARVKAEADAKAKAEADEKARIEKEAAEKAEAERIEALKPDKEKLMDFASRIKTIEVPTVEKPESQNAVNEALHYLDEAIYVLDGFCDGYIQHCSE